MRISEKWLGEWVELTDSTAELAHRLTMAGLEVDGIEPAAPAFEGVVVGEIVGCEPHPDADKLSVCRVAGGDGAELEVVCGAPNARPGLKAPFAKVGAVLPGDLRIRKARLRGVESSGMLCSAKELGLSDDASGLLELPADAPVGEDLRSYLELNDTVIEMDLTPNRSDCLGMAGVAREVGVLTRRPVTGPAIDAVEAVVQDTFPVELQAPADCPRYAGRVVRGIDPRAQTPAWMRERLRRAGVRPLSVAVDITNYVMLELGQPMHAFDLAKLEGGIRVRRAEPGETLELLNGDTATLDAETLVIADHRRPVAMAGIMGGEETAVTGDTVDVFLESAFFAPLAIAGRARAHGLHTDSSHRFERGVDPEGTRRAMERATALLVGIAGGRPGPVIDATEDAHLPRGATVALRPERVTRLLGTELPEADMREILVRLGMKIEESAAGGDAWGVQVPAYRFDIGREVDLIEELARVWGYDAVPAGRTPMPQVMGSRPEGEVPLRRLRRALVDRGYQEAITYSFVSPELQARLDPEQETLPLANPLSADMSVMRTSLWPGLVKTLLHNRNRQQDRVRVFETGLRFRGGADRLVQDPVIAGVAGGSARPEQWGEPVREVDFFDVKGDVEALLALTGQPDAFRFAAEPHPALHPGQSARVYRGDRAVGWLGAIHPAVRRDLELTGRTFVFELELEAIRPAAVPAFRELSRFPSIRRDLAVVVDEDVPAAEVRRCIESSAGELLRELVLFDVYRGRGVPEGRKSLAMGLILQHSSRTLTDEEVEDSIRSVVGRLSQELNAALRE